MKGLTVSDPAIVPDTSPDPAGPAPMKTTPMRILVLSEHWQGALACIQSFGRKGHHVTAAYSIAPTRNAQSDFVHDLVHLPQKQDALERARALGVLVRQRDIDLVVPISDDDALAVAHAAELFPESHAFVSVPSATIELVRDRNASDAFCRKIGVTVPNSCQVTRRDAAGAAAEIGFPCFLKVSGAVASDGVFEIASLSDLTDRLADLPDTAGLQLQSAVKGDFIGITGFCHDGKVLDSFAFTTGYGFSKAGTPPYAWRSTSKQAHAMLDRIAGALNWTGGIDLDLIEGPQGPTLLEINPRFSGTVNFALRSGHDLPAGYLALKGLPHGPPAFPPVDAPLFISLAEEARFRKRPGAARFARRTRAGHTHVDNGYFDDKGYSRPLKRLLWQLRLEEWKLRLRGLHRKPSQAQQPWAATSPVK